MSFAFKRSDDEQVAAQACAAAFSMRVPVLVVAGHYGVGKTNFAINLAMDAAASGKKVTLIDMDVVNPYFRSSEYREQLEAAGVRVVAPVFAERGSNLDVPSLTGAIAPAVMDAQEAWRAVEEAKAGEASAAEGSDAPVAEFVIIDAGGDDVGATAMARFAPTVKRAPYELLYVVNPYRNLTQTPQEALEVLREIEVKSGLTATAVTSNSHLMSFTTEEVVQKGIEFGRAVASEAGLPFACATYPVGRLQRENLSVLIDYADGSLYPVQMYVGTPWDAA